MGAQANTILLARPHPEIRPLMEPFIASAGFLPKVLSSLDQLPAKGERVSGAVISTTLRSQVKESYPEVFAILHSRYANLRVVFATLANPEAIQHNLELMVRRYVEGAVVMPAAEATLIEMRKPGLFLVITKAELLHAGRREKLRLTMGRYFGGSDAG